MKLRHEVAVAVLAAGNIASSLLLQLAVLAVLGPGRTTDAFFAAATLPTVVSSVLGVVLPAVLVPRWSAADSRTQTQEALALLLALAVAVGALALLLAVTAEAFFPRLFDGFGAGETALGVRLLRIQLIGMVASVGVAVLMALYAARTRFVVVEVATLVVAVLALAVLVTGLSSLGIAHAAWVASGRSVVLLLALAPVLGALDLPASLRARLQPVFKALGPLTAANAYYKSEMLVDRHLVSSAPPGDLSLYGIAHQVYSAGSAVLGKVWGSNAVPLLARHAAAADRAGFMRIYRRNFGLLVVVSLGAGTLVGLLGEPLLNLAVLPTRATPHDAHRIWLFLVLLTGVLVGGSVGALLAGGFYALGDTLTPTVLGMVSFTFFIVARFAVYARFGIDGLCLAVSAYYLANALLLALLLPWTVRRKLKS